MRVSHFFYTMCARMCYISLLAFLVNEVKAFDNKNNNNDIRYRWVIHMYVYMLWIIIVYAIIIVLKKIFMQ